MYCFRLQKRKNLKPDVDLKAINFVLLLFSLFISCGKLHNNSVNLIEVKDDLGNQIILNEIPKKIVSLAPNITETLFALGADSLIAGVTNYCDFPESARNKFKVGGMIDPDLELIISLNPDLIIVTIEGNSISTYKRLTTLGYKVFATNPRNFEGVIKMVKDLGILTNKKSESDMLISKMKNKKQDILLQSNNQIKDSCFIIISVTPLMTINKNTFINEIVELSGFINSYGDESSPYPEISWEDLIAKKPEYFILPGNLKDTISTKKIIISIKEKLKINIRESTQKFLLIDEDLFFRPGPRMLEAAEHLLYLKSIKKNK